MKMIKTVNVDMDITCKKIETALGRFFKKYPELDYWKETFEWMFEEGVEFFCDNMMADGTKNYDWSYALHLEWFESGHYYIAVVEREAE